MLGKYKKVVLGVLVAVGAFASIALATQSNAAVYNSRDCSTNSIIKCGTMSPEELRSKYAASSEIQALYGHFGITAGAINGALSEGVVNRDGTVTVNGKVVATGAQSVGRHVDNGSGCNGTPFTVNGTTYYKGAISCRAVVQSQAAFVMLDSNGEFVGAVIKGCGNPVPAVPVKVPKPSYACNYITVSKISRTEYQFNVNTSVANGAVNKDYVYSFGDGQSATVGAGGVKHTYAKPGTYTATVTPRFTVNNQVVTAPANAKCSTTVTIAPEPVTPAYACTSLAATPVSQADRSVLQFNFATTASATGGATIKGYTYNFGDGTTATAGATTSHTYKQSGTYTVTVSVNVTVNGQTKTVTSEGCKAVVKPHKNVVAPGEVFCNALDVKKISDTSYDLAASATASPAVQYVKEAGVINGYTFTVKDAKGTIVKTVTKTTSAQTANSGTITLTPGAYTAQVTVLSKTGDKTGPQCTVKIAVPAPNQIQVCRLDDYTIITINEKDFDSSKYSKDIADCQKVQVCDTTTNQVVTVTKEAAKDSKYTTDLSKCEKVTVCDTTTGKTVEVYANEVDNSRYTTDMSKCAATPVTTLPVTGIADSIAPLAGLGSLIAAISYYVASRRALLG